MNNVSLIVQTDVVNKLRRGVEPGDNCPSALQGGGQSSSTLNYVLQAILLISSNK